MSLIAGVNGNYKWLEAEHDLRELLSLCPEVVTGCYVAITSVDSGVFTPSEADVAAGWKSVGDIAYSPRLASPEEVPKNACCRDCSGFDEWYVFCRPRALGSLCTGNPFTTAIGPGAVFAFVNAFLRLSGPEGDAVTDVFWKQMAWIQPESYIADGLECLIFATRDDRLFTSVQSTLKAHPC